MSEQQRLGVSEVGDVTVVRFVDQKILDEAKIQQLGQELFDLVEVDGRAHPDRADSGDLPGVEAVLLVVVDIRSHELEPRTLRDEPDLMPRDVARVPLDELEILHWNCKVL